MAVTFQVRTSAGQPDRGAEILLDWFAHKQASTVQYGPDFLKHLSPASPAQDLLRLGGAVYCVDKIALRSQTADYWTRDLELQLPVSDPSRWNAARDLLNETLSFLSGDRWNVAFVDNAVEYTPSQIAGDDFDAVSLFSGGLDSLAGVVDLLEEGKRLLLVGHHDHAFPDHVQGELFDVLQEHYGKDSVALRRLWLRPAPPSGAQHRPLPNGQGENTTRTRSMLFLAAGIAVANAIGPRVPLYVPENGFIGINVPLTGARAGSLSTRTTHPLFMHRMSLLLEALGLQHEIRNPYRLMTKGEVLSRSSNSGLLMELAPRSVSCSHPEALRWREQEQGNCGYCFPCLIRRASMHQVGEDRSDEYEWDALTSTKLLSPRIKSGSSLRALVTSLGRSERPIDVLKNGRVPNGEVEAFFDVYKRGRAELRSWLMAGAGPELRRRLT